MKNCNKNRSYNLKKFNWHRLISYSVSNPKTITLLHPKTFISNIFWWIALLRGVSEKYPTCVHISTLVLFFVIRTVASFEVVPIWLNHALPAVLPHLKAILERRFWNGLQLAHRITLNRLDVVEPLSFERHFETRSFSSHGIMQSFQDFNVIFFVDRLTSSSKFIVHNTLTNEKNDINAGRILFGHTSYTYS